MSQEHTIPKNVNLHEYSDSTIIRECLDNGLSISGYVWSRSFEGKYHSEHAEQFCDENDIKIIERTAS